MNRLELVKVLSRVGHALSTTDDVKIFQCFMFDREEVIAYNDTLGITAPLQIDDAFAVNGAVLLGMLNNSNADEVTMTLDSEDLTIKAGKSIFKLPYFNEEEFIFEDPGPEWDLKFPIDNAFLRGLEACLLSVSSDDSQAALKGVCLHQGKKLMQLYSCDGDAVTRFTTQHLRQDAQNFFIPTAFCSALIKILDGEEGALLSLNKDWVKAQLSNGFVIFGRMIEIKKPLDHEDLIKRTMKSAPQFVKVPDAMNNALSRARVIADAISAKTVLTVKGGKLELLTQTDMGVIRDSLPMKGQDDVKANVSAEVIQRTASMCTEMAILDNCVAFREGEELFQLISNMN